MTLEGNHLCVGGPIAGQRREFDGHMRFAVRDRSFVLVDCSVIDSTPEVITMEKPTVYELRHFAANGEMINVWAPEGQSDLETMRIVLDAYEASTREKRS